MSWIVELFQAFGLAIHKLLNPHCEHCRVLEEDDYEKFEVCHDCERLALLLQQEKDEKRRLLDELFKSQENIEIAPGSQINKPIGPRYKTWRMIRQEMEAKIRIKNEPQSIKSLEDELGIKEDADQKLEAI